MSKVVVVGGGLLGCAVALELADRGASVVVLEKSVPGAEASSAAAGILAPRIESIETPGLREPGLASLALYPEWVRRIERHGASVDFRACGALRVALPGESVVDGEGVDVGDAAAIEPVPPGSRGWFYPAEAAVDPRKLVPAVHAAALAAGVGFRSGIAVLRLRPDGVHLTDGSWVRGRVVVCAGAWTARVPGLARVPVRPVRGQLVALRGAAVPERVLFGAGGYAVARADGRVIVGATVEEVGFSRGVTVGGLAEVLGIARRLLVGADGAEVIETWSGFRPGTPDGLPIVGDVRGVFVASGHYRSGILLAPLTARQVTDAVLDGVAPPENVSPGRFE